MAFLADTNILLRLTEPNNPEYTMVRSSVDALARRGEELCYTIQNLVEFWNVCTRPLAQNGFGLSTRETYERAAGVQVHDARLVAAMAVHGVSNILTLNDRDFARYSGIVAVHPRAVAERG